MKRFANLTITEGVIVDHLITVLTANGCKVSGFCDGELIFRPTSNRAVIEKAYNDYDIGVVHWTRLDSDGRNAGRAVLVHGNEDDVISDYTVGLESTLRPLLNFIAGE